MSKNLSTRSSGETEPGGDGGNRPGQLRGDVLRLPFPDHRVGGRVPRRTKQIEEIFEDQNLILVVVCTFFWCSNLFLDKTQYIICFDGFKTPVVDPCLFEHAALNNRFICNTQKLWLLEFWVIISILAVETVFCANFSPGSQTKPLPGSKTVWSAFTTPPPRLSWSSFKPSRACWPTSGNRSPTLRTSMRRAWHLGWYDWLGWLFECPSIRFIYLKDVTETIRFWRDETKRCNCIMPATFQHVCQLSCKVFICIESTSHLFDGIFFTGLLELDTTIGFIYNPQICSISEIKHLRFLKSDPFFSFPKLFKAVWAWGSFFFFFDSTGGGCKRQPWSKISGQDLDHGAICGRNEGGTHQPAAQVNCQEPRRRFFGRTAWR